VDVGNHLYRDRRASASGFTLVEMLVVVVIVAVLAVCSVPMYLSSARRARTGEGTAAIGAILQEEFRYKTENGVYLAADAGNVPNSPEADSNPGLGLDFSNSAYFGNACFSVALDKTYGFIIECNGGAKDNKTPSAGDVRDTRIQMRGSTRLSRISYDAGASWSDWQ